MEEKVLSSENYLELSGIDIKRLIHTIRGKQVMLDSDVAMLYNCEIKYVNRVAKRNIERFPEEFYFQLDNKEIYHCEASIKDVGKKCFAINKMEDTNLLKIL